MRDCPWASSSPTPETHYSNIWLEKGNLGFCGSPLEVLVLKGFSILVYGSTCVRSGVVGGAFTSVLLQPYKDSRKRAMHSTLRLARRQGVELPQVLRATLKDHSSAAAIR